MSKRDMAQLRFNEMYHQMSRLSYVGNRPYIRGADLYGIILDGLKDKQPDAYPVSIDQFRLVREVKNNGQWQIDGESHKDALATMKWRDQTGNKHRAEFLETGDLITARIADNPSLVNSMEHTGDLEARATPVGVNTALAAMNFLVEINKAALQRHISVSGGQPQSIRFVYLENAAIMEKINAPMVISPAGQREYQGLTYSLTNISSNEMPSSLQICFCYQA